MLLLLSLMPSAEEDCDVVDSFFASQMEYVTRRNSVAAATFVNKNIAQKTKECM
jgi:hypothetical protein